MKLSERHVRLLASMYFHGAMGLCLASILYFVWMSGASPPHPVPETGQVVQLNDHGSYSYARWWEAGLAQSQGWIVFSAFLATAIGDRFSRPKPQPKA